MTRHHRIITSAAAALALGAGAAPAAAVPMNVNAAGSYVPANVSTPSVSTSPTIVRVSPANSGFDWGDAGIGAAGGFAISMLGIGGALAVSHRRTRREIGLS